MILASSSAHEGAFLWGVDKLADLPGLNVALGLKMDKEFEVRHVYRESDPVLYEKLVGMMTASVSEIEIEGQSYSVAQDKDDDGTGFFVLVPSVSN